MSSVSYISAATTTAASTAATATTTSTTSSISDEKTTFLNLLVTQLQNQNPLDPVDTTEFTNQLVAYSSLEQQMNTNDNLETIISALNTSSSLNAFSYIGANVDVDSNESAVQSGTAEWKFTLEDDASAATLKVSDASGNVLYTKTLGATDAGTYDFSVDSVADGLNLSDGTGLYLSVSAQDSEGSNVNTSILSSVKVDSVQTDGDGTLTLYAGNTSFAAEDITAMRQSAATTSTTV